MPQITYNCKIEYEFPEDEAKLRQMLESARTAFNISSEAQFGAKRCIKTLHKAVYRKIRDSHPEIPSGVVVQSERACLSAYRSCNSNGHKLESPIIKKQLSLQLNCCISSHQDNWIKVISLQGKRIRIKPLLYAAIKELLSKYSHGDCSIFDKNGIFYLSYVFKIPDVPVHNDLACGIDLGIRRFAATSEGKVFKDKKYNGERRKLRYLKRCLQSKGTKSSKQHLKKLRSKERNQTRNFVHHLSKQIIESTSASILVIEDLTGIKDKKKRKISKHRKFKGLAQVSFHMLRVFLTYKAQLYRKVLVTVSPYKTSQIDHRTRRCNGSARKGCRFYSKKGLVFDADVNAAINIARRAKHPVSCSKALDGQAVVNRPIVGKLPTSLPL